MTTWFRKTCASVLAILALAACGGGGGDGSGNITAGGSGGTNQSNIPAGGSGGASQIFLADSQNQVVLSSADANPPGMNPPPGALTVTRTISGPGAGSNMPDMVYDSANDRLYVVNDTSIAVIDNASTASGNAPARVLNTLFGGTILSVSLDAANDELYVSNGASGIFVFDHVSTASGPVSPIRTITMTRNNLAVVPKRIFVDTTHNVLYTELTIVGGESIAIFGNARTLGTSSLPSPVVVGNELTFSGVNITGFVANGATDRLFVAEQASFILVFDGASLANGAATPNRTIDTPTALQKIALATGTDRLYGISADRSRLYIINSASTANSTPMTVVPVTEVTNQNVGSLTGLAVAQQ